MKEEPLVQPLPEDVPSTGSTKLSNARHQLFPHTSLSCLLFPEGARHLWVAPANGKEAQVALQHSTVHLRCAESVCEPVVTVGGRLQDIAAQVLV